MHNWGDESVDWDGINAAASFIAKGLLKWRVPVRDYKEKYGTVRIYTNLGWSSIHDITHPGHAFIRYRRGSLLWHLNYARWMTPVIRMINLFVVPLHKHLYRRYYAEAVRRWPHLRQEITCAADYSELLEGIK